MNKILYLISCGPGNDRGITLEALDTIEKCDFIYGSLRLIGTFASHKPHQLISALPLEAAEIINNSDYRKIGVLLSGDAGFYSLAQPLRKLVTDRDIITIPGVGIVQAATARLNIPWQSLQTVSLHRNNTRPVEVDHIHNYLVLCREGLEVKTLLPENIEQNYQIWVVTSLDTQEEKFTEWTGKSFTCPPLTTLILLKKN